MAGLRPFNLQLFLTKVGRGKTILKLKSNEIVCSQGDTADAVFYITDGKIKLCVVSQKGKEAVVAILNPRSFLAKRVWPVRRLTWRPPSPLKMRRSCVSRRKP
jgi:hypothetical protein